MRVAEEESEDSRDVSKEPSSFIMWQFFYQKESTRLDLCRSHCTVLLPYAAHAHVILGITSSEIDQQLWALYMVRF